MNKKIMKKILLLVFLSFFLNQLVNAKSALDYLGSKKGSLDSHYKCVVEGIPKEFGFKKVNKDLFVFGFDPEEKIYDAAFSKVIKRRSKMKNGGYVDMFIFYDGTIDNSMPTGPGLKLRLLFVGDKNKNKIYYEYWIDIPDNNNNTEWLRILSEETRDKFNKKLSEWTNNMHKLVSKKLGLEENFGAEDLTKVNWNNVLLEYNGKKVSFKHICPK